MGAGRGPVHYLLTLETPGGTTGTVHANIQNWRICKRHFVRTVYVLYIYKVIYVELKLEYLTNYGFDRINYNYAIQTAKLLELRLQTKIAL